MLKIPKGPPLTFFGTVRLKIVSFRFLQTRVPVVPGQRALLPAEDAAHGRVPRDPHQLPGLLQAAGLQPRPHLGLSAGRGRRLHLPLPPARPEDPQAQTPPGLVQEDDGQGHSRQSHLRVQSE